MSENNSLVLHKRFATTDEAIRKVEAYLDSRYEPMLRETKETVKNFNRKCQKTEHQITKLSKDQQYSHCRTLQL